MHRVAGSDQLRSTLIRDIHSLARIASEWDALIAASDTPQAFFLTSSCILPFWKWHGADRELAVVVIRDGRADLVGAAPFYVATVGRRLSRHRQLALMGSPESGADYLDVVARPGLRPAVLGETFRCLSRERVRWDVVNLNYMLDDSATPQLLVNGCTGLRFWTSREASSPCPYIRLPATWDEYLGSLGTSTRQAISHKLSKLQRRFTDVRFEMCTDEQEIREHLGTLIRYKQDKYGHQFDYEYPAWTDQALAAQRAGRLRLWTLKLDGHPACLWLTFQFGRRVFYQAPAYDLEYAKFSPGQIMMAHAIRAAIEEGSSHYDLKRGDDAYKYHWANGQRHTIQVQAVRRSLRGAWIWFPEYSPTVDSIRRRTREAYRSLRRSARTALRPVAAATPWALPRRLRERVLKNEGPPPDAAQAGAAGELRNPPSQAATREAALRTELVRVEPDLAGLASEWDALLAESDTPGAYFLSSQWLLPFWRWHGQGRELTVVLVRDGRERLVGLAPFYVQRAGRGLSRHRRLALLGSPEGEGDYLDVIARPGMREAVVRASFRCLEERGVRWDDAYLDYILSDSATLGLIREGAAGRRVRMYSEVSSACSYATLPRSWPEYEASLGASTRRGIRYQMNLIQRRFRDVRFELCTTDEEIREGLATLVRHKQARYGHEGDHDYRAWPEQCILARNAGCLRLWILRLDGRPACAWFTILHAKRVFFVACSYNPEYAQLRLGKVMMAHSVHSAIEEGAIEYDMKRGDAGYKNHWSNGERTILRVHAVRRSPWGAWVGFWEYSALMGDFHRRAHGTYRAFRRSARLALSSVAARWPHSLPRRLRDRVLSVQAASAMPRAAAQDSA